MNNNKYKIIFTGGGTGGSVTPLLAIYDEFSKDTEKLKETEFVWIGTKTGIENKMVSDEGIRYISIASGKLRRYFSWQNFVDFFIIILAFFQALIILQREKPRLVMSAGGFVCVPVIWAAWVMRIPTMIHQQDIRAGLANKLMSPFASIITVTFESSLADYGKKAVWTGNPIRNKILASITKDEARNYFNIKSDKPVIFVVGGGTGSEALNKLIFESLNRLLPNCEIIHALGKRNKIEETSGYHPYEFLNIEEISKAYTTAEIIVSRCGLGILTELSNLGKPAILIPIPDSHQEDNAEIYMKNKAAIVLNQKELTPEKLSQAILNLLGNDKLKKELSLNIGKVIKKKAASEIISLIKNNKFF